MKYFLSVILLLGLVATAQAEDMGCFSQPGLARSGQISVPSADGQGELPLALGKVFDLDMLKAIVEIREAYANIPRVEKQLCIEGRLDISNNRIIVDRVSVK